MGFIGLDAWDLPYHELISAGHSDLIMEPSPSLHEQQKLLSQEESVMKMISPMYYVRREDLQRSEKVEAFLNWCFKKVSIHKQAIVLGLTWAQIKNIIYEYRVLSKIANRTRKSINMRRLKLKTRHIEWLAEFVESRGIRGFTLAEAWHHLQHEFPTLGWISQSTVDRILNQKLGLSYKKLGGTNIKKTRPDSRASLVSWT